MCALHQDLRAGAELANRVPPQIQARGRPLHRGDRAEVFRWRGVLQIQDPQSTHAAMKLNLRDRHSTSTSPPRIKPSPLNFSSPPHPSCPRFPYVGDSTRTVSSAETATPTLSMYQNLPTCFLRWQLPCNSLRTGSQPHLTAPTHPLLRVPISDHPELVPMLGPKPKQPSYAVVDIVRLPPSTVKNRPTKPRILKQTSLNMIPAMEPKSSPKSSSSVSNRQRSLSTFNDVSDSGSSHQDVFPEESDSRNKGVVYASLDMVAMSAVEHEHKDVRNFEDLLQRHSLREEMNRRCGKVSTSHDQ